MAQYVAPEIESLRETPTPGEVASVALVVESDATAVKDRVRDHDGTVVRELPSGVIIAEIPEPELDAFCATDLLESVSLSDQLSTL